jgi:hypothetical protein
MGRPVSCSAPRVFTQQASFVQLRGKICCEKGLRRQDSNSAHVETPSSSEKTRSSDGAKLGAIPPTAAELIGIQRQFACTSVPNLSFTVADVLAMLQHPAETGPDQRKAIRRALLAVLTALEEHE